MVNVTASYSPRTFSFESSKELSDLCLANSRVLYFWQVPESIHKFIIELHILQCLFVRRSKKKTRRGKFNLLWQPSALGGNLTMGPHPLPSCTLQKRPLSPSVWPRREYIWTLNWTESLLICFKIFQGVPYFLRH